MAATFFADPDTAYQLTKTIQKLKTTIPDQVPREQLINQLLLALLSKIKDAPEQFDLACPYNIAKIGDSIKSQLSENALLEPPILLANLYRIYKEYYLSLGKEPSVDFYRTLNSIEEIAENKEFNDRLHYTVGWANKNMPFEIFNFKINQGDLKEAQQLSKNLIDLKSSIASFEAYMDEQKNKIDAMKSIIEKHKTELNFVVLDQGFSHLLDSKKENLTWIKRTLTCFGIFLILIPTLVAYKLQYSTQIEKTMFEWVLHALPVISVELILLYFFRISHFQLNSANTQILQLELRRSLCQFIEGYANYSSSIKKQDPTALEKFESLIFSGLTSSEEKLPTTFDGLDSLIKLVNTAKGTAKD